MHKLILLTAFFFFSKTLVAQVERLETFDLADGQKLLSRLFDSDKFDTLGEVLWKPRNFADAVSANFSDDGYQHTALDTVLYFSSFGGKRAVAVFATQHYEKGEVTDCHSCGADISAAIFHETVSGRWQVEQFAKHFTALGSFGETGEASLTQFGNDEWCLRLDMEWVGQGVYSQYASFWDLEDLNRVFSYVVHEDNSGAVGDDPLRGYFYDKTIHFKGNEDTGSAWWDFDLVTRGTMYDSEDEKSAPANRVVHYTFDPETNSYTQMCE
jgi:hypothetical protein